MKITKIDTFMVKKPNTIFLKMYTNKGIVGYGEPMLEGHSFLMTAAIKQFEEYLLGKDPIRINDHWQALYRGGFFRGGPVMMSAISGIEQAMWDILGKYLRVPVYQLLGGNCRDRIRIYHTLSNSESGDWGPTPPKKFAEEAIQKVAKGFTALKFTLPIPAEIIDNRKYIEKSVSSMEVLRKAVGSSVDIAIDFHGRLSPGMAKLLIKELEPFTPFFIEEPCLPENIDSMVDIARSTHIPIATGERLYTKWGFRELLEKQAAFILQPDASHAGGVMELKNIAAMAEVYYCGIAPHCPLGPIALASCLQVDAAIPNFLIQEQRTMGEGYSKEPFKFNNGYIELPKKPGLGIELDEKLIEENIYDGSWRIPKICHEDGSVADW
ncbi:MAG: galactonate dehydratase [Actinobacteria bacterium]|nr:galactonate dehydratase [Actinomycetota bacterium]